MKKPIYLQLHYRETKKAIAEHICRYNAWLMQNCPSEFKALKIKAPVLNTIHTILDAYSKFLRTNEKQGLTDPKFCINNKAIATMQSDLRSSTTIWRHIKRATEAGIFDKSGYVWHGSNSSFELAFNPNVLVAEVNQDYCDLLFEMYNRNVNNPPISVDNHLKILAARPPFSHSFNGCMVTFCNHIVPVKHLQEQDINMDKAENVNKPKMTVAAAEQSAKLAHIFELIGNPNGLPDRNILQEQGNMITPLQKMAVAAANVIENEAKEQEQIPAGRVQKTLDKGANDLLNFYTEQSLKIALRVLYSERFVDESDIPTAQRHIRKYFTSSTGRKLGELYFDFQLVIYEAHKSISRKHYIPAPIFKYFDSQFNGGFYSGLVHLETIVKPYIQKNEEYKKSISDVLKLYRKHIENPNDFQSYKSASQYLGKKKNKSYLQFFNKCVDAKSIETSDVANFYKQQIHQ